MNIEVILLKLTCYLTLYTLQVPSNVLMSIAHETTSPAQASLTPLGEACSTCNLTAIHEILEKAGYKEDEGIANEVSMLRIP